MNQTWSISSEAVPCKCNFDKRSIELDVSSREEALAWAQEKIGGARCEEHGNPIKAITATPSTLKL